MRLRPNRRSAAARGLMPLAVIAALAAPLAGPATAALATNSAPTTWTYEADAVGAVPAGCQTPAGKAPALVSDEAAFHGAHSLKLDDQSATAISTVVGSSDARVGASLGMQVKPELQNGFLVDLTGTTTAGSGVVFHLLLRADGSIAWYDGARWLPVAVAGTVPQHAWSHLEVGATANQDMIYVRVNGQLVGSAGPWGINPVTSITGFQLASNGTATTGDTVYVDDVRYGPALPQRPAEVKRQFRFGDLHTMVSSTTPAQMPNTAVRVPRPGGGERILALVGRHTDTATTAGNSLFYSDDGGTTWGDYQAHNPMPDAPSFFVTKLANGDLYALNYHGYANGNPKQSVLESAISTDNGVSWTTRDGVLNAPANLAPYTCERPAGCTAIVQVHNVIEDPDGTLYQSAYGRYDGDAKLRQLNLVSHDRGLNWDVQATVATNDDLPTSGSDGACEGVLVRTGPHSFLMVMRAGSYQAMSSTRSDDNGKTWTKPQLLKTVSGQTVSSVFPALERLSDGSLLLMVGRPGLALLRSYDNGATWTDPVWTDYTNSANGYMLPMGGQTVMLFGDRGANWQSPKEYAAWSQLVTAVGRH